MSEVNCNYGLNDPMHLNAWYSESVYPIADNQRQAIINESAYLNGEIMQYAHLYVIYNFDNKLYKIGITNNIKARFRQLVTQSGCNLHLLFDIWFENCYDESAGLAESKLHEYFRPKRKQGEWFDLNLRDLVKIRRWADNNLEIYYHPFKKSA